MMADGPLPVRNDEQQMIYLRTKRFNLPITTTSLRSERSGQHE
jgi:hypothetical protein